MRRIPRQASARAAPGAACPACGRFMGWQADCPYCETDSARRPALRRARAALPLLALAGLGLALAAGPARPARRVHTGQREPALLGSAVRASGAVAGGVAVRRSGGDVAVVAFALDDGTGPLPVLCRGATAVGLAARRPALKEGDRLALDGRAELDADGRERLVVDSISPGG